MEQIDTIWTNARIVVLDENQKIKILENSFLAIKDKKIIKIAKMSELGDFRSQKIYDVNNKLITSSLIDCHTHLIFGGNRANEFEKRLNGESYAQIAKQGGGIISSIKSTRELSFDELYKQAKKRLIALIKEGVGTIEIKTGYGLDLKSEIKMLKVAKKLEEDCFIHIEKTFLGAHAVPPEFKNDADGYIDYICDTMLDEVHKLGLVTCVDGYCEHLAFSTKQISKVFKKAKSLGLNVKLHAEQFSSMGASDLACSYDAISTDHLEYIEENSIINMKKSNTVAVLLPGAFYFLRETKLPPIELFRKHKVPIAIASDLNPGTATICSMQMMMNMSAVLFSLSVDEVFLAVTLNAAKALGLGDTKGSLELGKDGDFCVWDMEHPRDLVCAYLPNRLDLLVRNGEIINV